jgi:hypothetical protein
VSTCTFPLQNSIVSKLVSKLQYFIFRALNLGFVCVYLCILGLSRILQHDPVNNPSCRILYLPRSQTLGQLVDWIYCGCVNSLGVIGLILEGSGSIFPGWSNPCLSCASFTRLTRTRPGGRRPVPDLMTSRDSGS